MNASIRAALFTALAMLAFTLSTLSAFAADPLVFKRDGHCPPLNSPKPIEGSDIVAPGPPPTVTAWLVYRYHWDDGNGNDLTVDSMCVANGNYFSLRITQSKNGVNTVVATPGGVGGVVDPGACCPFDNASNIGPAFELPDTALHDSKLIPRLITSISKNPHLPGQRDNAPGRDYHKTLIWLVPGRAIKGTIDEDSSGKITFPGEFSTPRSPNGKKGEDLDDVEKENLKALFADEKAKADTLEKKRFPGLERVRELQKKKNMNKPR
jgi:hypothetical protein